MTKYYSEEEILKRAECTDVYFQVKNILNDTPVADVTEVRRGQWIEDKTYAANDKKVYFCSVCNHWQKAKNQKQLNQIMYMNFCPFCGAKMDIPQIVSQTYGFDDKVIRLATDMCVRKLKRINSKYISALLKKWHADGLRTYGDVKKYKEARTKERADDADNSY